MTQVSNFFFFVFYLLCNRRHQLKRFLWLAVRASCVRPRADEDYSVILEEDDGRESMCLLLSWMCSHNCFVRSFDSCCFNLFNPHRFLTYYREAKSLPFLVDHHGTLFLKKICTVVNGERKSQFVIVLYSFVWNRAVNYISCVAQ